MIISFEEKFEATDSLMMIKMIMNDGDEDEDVYEQLQVTSMMSDVHDVRWDDGIIMTPVVEH